MISIALPFKKEIHEKSLNQFFNESLKPLQKRKRDYTLISLIVLVVGILILIKNGPQYNILDILSAGFAFHFVWATYNLFEQEYRFKKKYKKLIQEDLERMDVPDQRIVMEFTDDFFFYSEKDYSMRFGWNMFRDVRFDDSVIYLDLKRSDASAYIIMKDYIGNEDFQRIKDFVAKKIISVPSEKRKKGQEELLDS